MNHNFSTCPLLLSGCQMLFECYFGVWCTLQCHSVMQVWMVFNQDISFQVASKTLTLKLAARKHCMQILKLEKVFDINGRTEERIHIRSRLNASFCGSSPHYFFKDNFWFNSQSSIQISFFLFIEAGISY